MKKFIGLIFLIFLFNTNIVFGNNQGSNNLECIYEKNYKLGFPNVVCKNLYDSSQKLISSGKGDIVKRLNNYVSKLSQSKLTDLHKNLGKVKQTEKNKDLLRFLSVLVYNTSEKYRKVDDKYIYNGFGDKIGYKPLENGENPTIQPKTYEELANILNEKFVLDLTSFPAFTPRVYQYISTSADNGFTDKFYTFMYNIMYQSKDIKLPIYLIPGWVGFEGYGKKEYGVGNSNTPSINLDISKLPTIDIKNYPSLKYIVENFCDNYNAVSDGNIGYGTKISNVYKDDVLNKYNGDVSKDFYKLLIDKGIDKNDITFSGATIFYEDPLSKEIKEKEYVSSGKKPEEIINDSKDFFKNLGKKGETLVDNIWDDICPNSSSEDWNSDRNLCTSYYTPSLFQSSYRNHTKVIFSQNLSTRLISERLITTYDDRHYFTKDGWKEKVNNEEKKISLENNYTYFHPGAGLYTLYNIYVLKLSGYEIKNTNPNSLW